MSTQESLVPDYEQKNTTGVTPSIRLNLTAPNPPLMYLDRDKAEYSEQIERRTQQIVFMPCFVVTDHIFHGDRMDSYSPADGFPTVRTAMISGTNFHLTMQVNFNARDRGSGTSTIISMRDEIGRPVHIAAHEGMIDPESAKWLTESILAPVQDELMAMPAEELTQRGEY